MRLPRLSGRALRAFIATADAEPVRSLVYRVARKQLGLDDLAALPDSMRTHLPLDVRPVVARSLPNAKRISIRPESWKDSRLGPLPVPTSWPPTGRLLTNAYRASATTPTEIAERAFREAAALADRPPYAGPLLAPSREDALRSARASTERYASGTALGPLDGVPVTIKEQMDIAGLRTNAGTNWVRADRASHDGTLVARLRSAGAIVLGHSAMTELGMSPVGVNGQRNLPRNPHDPTCVAGGSSTGAAVSVATGLVPVAHGADGGGSIRVPASLCGVFGLKPTFGRIPGSGDIFGGTLNHEGPIASNVTDLASFMAITSGDDSRDARSRGVGRLEQDDLDLAIGRGVRGLRIGVPHAEWERCSGTVSVTCREALRGLTEEGATLVDVDLPLGPHARAIGYVTITSELYADMRGLRDSKRAEFGPDMRLVLMSASQLGPDEYLDAQRVRGALREQVANVLRSVDVIALPTTARTAVSMTGEEFDGFLDPAIVDAMCTFSFLGNVTGLPAGTAPVGSDARGLPIGLQIVGDAWDEASVIAVLAHLERTGLASVKRPVTVANVAPLP